MKEEISAAVLFVSKLAGASITGDVMAKFERRLAELLEERFSNHWHPERPWQGQGYRCLRVNANSRKEPTIERAARDCGLRYKDLNLPVELTVWVDPEEVCCRFGEQKGSCCTVASFRDGNKENFIESFDFSQVERPSARSQSSEVLKEKRTGPSNVPSAPSSTQSTPTKRKPTSSGTKSQMTPSRSLNSRERRPFGSHHNHYSSAPLHHQNGSYSPPFYKTQSWVNLSQTPPPPPPPPHLLSSSSFMYSPTPPHYTHAQMPPNFTRSLHNVAHKFRWNASSYPRNDRHQWLGHRALARV